MINDDQLARALQGSHSIIRCLGQGTMGAVYLARETHSNRLLALEVLDEGLGSNEEGTHFAREAALLTNLSLPNVVTVYEHGCVEGFRFLSREFVQGCSLGQWLAKRERCSEFMVCTIGYAVSAALMEVHKLGIIHQHVNPENIVLVLPEDQDVATALELTSPKQIKLTDFGIPIGEPGYLAPESICGDAPTSAADIYGLGATLYRALSGKAPYAGTLSEVQEAHLSGSAPSLREIIPNVPRGLAHIIERCMEREPQKRYSEIEVLHTRIHALAGRIPSRKMKPIIEAVPAMATKSSTSKTASYARSAAYLVAFALVILVAFWYIH